MSVRIGTAFVRSIRSAGQATFDVPAGAGFKCARLVSVRGDVVALVNPAWADRL